MGSRLPKVPKEPKYPGDQTRIEATTPLAPLAQPLDKDYLCAKCCVALLNPLTNRLGRPMYQRTVTRSIWADNRLARQYWRYKGEVGYDMTKNPPVPIMSAEDPYRPSTFPLSALHSINREARAAAEAAAEVAGNVLSRNELEIAGGKRLRIPDVIVLKCTAKQIKAILDSIKDGPDERGNFNSTRIASGRAGKQAFIPAQKNLERIVEVKFDGDFFRDGQQKAYATIAGKGEFNLLEPEHPDPDLGCKCREKRKQPQVQTVPASEKAPARKPSKVPDPVLAPTPVPAGSATASQISDPERPVAQVLQDTPTTQIGDVGLVVVAGYLAIKVIGVLAAPETGGLSLAVFAF